MMGSSIALLMQKNSQVIASKYPLILSHLSSVAYLESAKGGGPVGSRGKAPVGGMGDDVPQKLTLFVNECLNFDVLDEKN